MNYTLTPSQIPESRFARKQVPVTVTIYKELSITDCMNFLPKELKKEIWSYLPMGIILSLYEQSQSLIMHCLKKEHDDRFAPFSAKFYSTFNSGQLINIILNSESINKKYIMRHFINFKKSQIKKQKYIAQQLSEKNAYAETLKVGDYIINENNGYGFFLILKKTKCTFKCAQISSDVVTNSIKILNKSQTEFTPRISNIRFTSICRPPNASQCAAYSVHYTIKLWLHKINILNTANHIEVNSTNTFGLFSHGLIPKDEVAALVLQLSTSTF